MTKREHTDVQKEIERLLGEKKDRCEIRKLLETKYGKIKSATFKWFETNAKREEEVKRGPKRKIPETVKAEVKSKLARTTGKSTSDIIAMINEEIKLERRNHNLNPLDATNLTQYIL